MEPSRKLAAILAADAAGYSRLMQEDERATLTTLDAYRHVFREQIEAHQGRVVDMAGDSVLAVFESATEAVSAALEIQSALATRNEAFPEARRMRFRIG
ncbi:MAG TPA: adenylate/guanylate cyclase domain-containing protein, partial [Burkholderiales bacterium]|nr:adenylate/guanylate cyclase domain-containing protein [Burkholderiales bacterium]